MAKNNKADMSCARVKKYTASDVSKAERHNERKNETYENMNVIEERIPFNVHFKTPTAPTYICLLYTSPSPRDRSLSRMPSSA